jgi:hypothetical protein
MMAYLQSIGFPLRNPLDCANRNVFFDSTYTAEYLTTHWVFFYLHVDTSASLLEDPFFPFRTAYDRFVFVFFCFLWPGAVGGYVKEGRIVCTIEAQ